MPDEDTATNPEPETQPDTQPEPATEPEPEVAETESVDDRKLWESVVLDLPYDDIDSEARTRVLLKRLAAQAAKPSAEPTGAEGTVQAGEARSQPPVPKVPTIDHKGLLAEAKRAIEEGDALGLTTLLQQHLDYTDGIGAMVADLLEKHEGRVGAVERGLKDLSVPMQLRVVLPNVAGAVEADIAPARKLMESGEVKTAQTALKLAALDRKAEIEASAKPKPKRSASEEAKRKAAAIQASKEGRPSPQMGGPALPKIPRNAADYADVFKKDQERQAQG